MTPSLFDPHIEPRVPGDHPGIEIDEQSVVALVAVDQNIRCLASWRRMPPPRHEFPQGRGDVVFEVGPLRSLAEDMGGIHHILEAGFRRGLLVTG
ncbi:hypothetical protein AB0346_00775 [Nocardia beijingensis]|uniref:hypothetical protein n=1 Tax=Nocardia beijingensis TaxID=95162 RepID=UPI00344BA4C9